MLFFDIFKHIKLYRKPIKEQFELSLSKFYCLICYEIVLHLFSVLFMQTIMGQLRCRRECGARGFGSTCASKKESASAIGFSSDSNLSVMPQQVG